VDWSAPGADAAVRRLAELGAVVVALGASGPTDAARALSLGAECVVPAPSPDAPGGGRDATELAVRRAAEKARLRQAVREGAGRRVWPAAAAALAGTSDTMRDVAGQLEWAAGAEAPLLLLGEPGSEKARVAELVHASGTRAYQPFVALRCSDGSAAMTDGSALAAADGGTLYLDEVASLDAEAQRALFAAAGARTVRVIAATQADLATEVTEGNFHEALYYVLSAVAVSLPPLRARTREDVRASVDAAVAALEWEPPGEPPALDAAAMDRLLGYAWPGNLRELRAVLDRAASLARGTPIGVAQLPTELRGAEPDAPSGAGARSLEDVERSHIERALRDRAGNRTHAARDLGIARATLIKKIKAYGLGARAYAGHRSDDA
jgi:DNA-binding NtrC family response regulator